jgi:CubicO group peptidase (beta-lactamase class C family)
MPAITAIRTPLIVTLFAATLNAATDYYPPPDSQGGWRSLTGAVDVKVRKVAGIDRQKLDEAFQYAQTTSQHGGLLVVRHGWLVYERYYGRGNREANPDMASCGKAFTSISCGIMLKEQHDRIPNGLDEKVFTEKYLPEAFPLSDPAKAEIKLGHLLAMSSGMHENSAASYVRGEKVKTDATPVDRSLDIDQSALRTPLWCKPGEGYSYASGSPHIASIVLRHLTGMELQEYIDEKLAKPMQFGRWGYAMHRGSVTLPHTPGGGSIALRSTDALRFAYLLLHKGRYQGKQLVPAEYIELCGKPSPYNPHYPFSLQFEVNADGHVAGAPRDAFWKSGAGGFGIYMVPSLDLVIYKMAGTERQYDPALTGLPLLYKYDGSRDNWKDTKIGADEGVRRIVEMVAAAVIQ